MIFLRLKTSPLKCHIGQNGGYWKQNEEAALANAFIAAYRKEKMLSKCYPVFYDVAPSPKSNKNAFSPVYDQLVTSLEEETLKTAKPKNLRKVFKEELEDGEMSVSSEVEPEEGEILPNCVMSHRETPINSNISGDTIKKIKKDWE